MSSTPELLVVEGPLKDRRFAVGEAGLRLGRSSSCEISIPDPALSRNHCLFETRDGALWVTDLASANGTFVNDAQLGADSRPLAAGDRVVVGDSVLCVTAAGEPPAVGAPTVDLGLGKGDAVSAAEKPSARRLALWAVAALAVAGAGVMVLSDGEAVHEAAPAEQPLADVTPRLCGFTFEKVEAGPDGVYRYALSYDGAGALSVEIDDVPKENRHVRKTAQLSADAQARLADVFSAGDLYRLAPEYAGVPLRAGTLKSFALRVIRGTQVFSLSIENAPEPDIFRETREKLETFSKNELGIWAIQYSAEKLVEMSDDARRTGDAKWEERDVQYGNLSAALSAYDEAVFYLDTVNPKPASYGALAQRRQEVAAELARRYRDQRFRADRAINLGDWETALRELRVLCELVPAKGDPRHAEASAKLLDVEVRMKKSRK